MVDIRRSISGRMERIVDLSNRIYQLAELGSQEVVSSQILCDFLSSEGFKITKPLLNMKTAFRAEYGKGGTTIGFLAEYDALPNGHSCGHNLISAWAVGCATVLKDVSTDIKIVVIGTPSEEGIGEYAGSKVTMAAQGVFDDIDMVFGFHADDRWGVGSTSLADITLQLTFSGKASHGADAPQLGINALDAAVSTYSAINSLRGWAKNDRHLVIGMVIREGGQATNVIPDKAVMDVEIRSTSSDFVREFSGKVENMAISIGSGYGATVKVRQITPLYESYLHSRSLDSILVNELKKLNINPVNVDDDSQIPSGSTDEANVSMVVPTGHIDMQIGYPGIPGHSDEFREAANPYACSTNLSLAIEATVNAAIRASSHKMKAQILGEFQEAKKK